MCKYVNDKDYALTHDFTIFIINFKIKLFKTSAHLHICTSAHYNCNFIKNQLTTWHGY
jgi:hypothetical protein